MQRGLVHLLSVIAAALFALAPEIAMAQGATCAIPPGVKENVEKQIREYSAWLQRETKPEERGKAYNNRSNAYFTLRRFDLAVKDREAERATTGKLICQMCLARAYLANGQYDRAISELTDINERRKPGYYSQLCYRGMTYHRMGDYDRAIKDYEEAMLDAEDFKSCGLYGRGLAKFEKGDVAGGQVDMNAAKAADAKAKYQVDYAYFFCMHGLTGGGAKPSNTSSQDGALAGWVATMKRYGVPEAAPHFLAAALCDGCEVAGIYCKRPLRSVSDLKSRKVAIASGDREFANQVSAVTATAFLPNGEIVPALDHGLVDCAVGRR